jgi:hypothetical protein
VRAPAATKGIRRDGTDTSSTGSQSATRAQREALAAMPYDEVAAFTGALRASYGGQIARDFDSGLEPVNAGRHGAGNTATALT